MMRTGMSPEMLVSFNHLTQLIAWEDFMKLLSNCCKTSYIMIQALKNWNMKKVCYCVSIRWKRSTNEVPIYFMDFEMSYLFM